MNAITARMTRSSSTRADAALILRIPALSKFAMKLTTCVRSCSMIFTLFMATCVAAGPAEDSEREFILGKRIEGLPDLSRLVVIKEGALVCDTDSVFATNQDVAAASGDARALEALRTQCINWHDASRVSVLSPMSTVRRYDMARRFQVVEFTVQSALQKTDASGFVRLANLTPSDAP